MTMLPEGALLKVTLEVRMPVAGDDSLIDRWLRFHMLARGDMPNDHPLTNQGPDEFGIFGLDWEFTGFTGREEHYDERPTENGGKRYKVRYVRERAA